MAQFKKILLFIFSLSSTGSSTSTFSPIESIWVESSGAGRVYIQRYPQYNCRLCKTKRIQCLNIFRKAYNQIEQSISIIRKSKMKTSVVAKNATTDVNKYHLCKNCTGSKMELYLLLE